jgi:opacity protein-like surface antigen
MMRVVPAVLCLLLSMHAIAQKDRLENLFVRAGSLSIEGGLAMPVMDYAAEEPTLAAGYANLGHSFRISAGYDVLPLFGFRLTYSNFANPTDAGQLKTDYTNAGVQVQSLEWGSYKVHGVQFGIYSPVRLIGATIEIRAMAGFMNSVLPAQTLRYYNTTLATNVTHITHENESNNVGFSGGVGIRQKLKDNILLMGSLDFYYAEQNFRNTITTVIFGGNSYNFPGDYTQYFHVVFINVGIGYQFQ